MPNSEFMEMNLQDNLKGDSLKDYKNCVKDEIEKWFENTSFVEFYNEIKESVIGQDSLKLILGNIYNYLTCVMCGNRVDNNMLLSAPSGCGKTETYRALKKYFSVHIPSLDVYIFDTTSITSNGFRGEDASAILDTFRRRRLSQPYGIVFLDEFDKKIAPIYNGSAENVNASVQADMLMLIEGGDVNCGRFVVNTEDLMFIGMGSFESFRKKRDEKEVRTTGFNSSWSETEEDKHYNPLSRENILEAGASNELVGRFPYIVNYNPLTDDAIYSIIDKCVVEVSENYNLESMCLGDDMIEHLKSIANGKFGCRLIKAELQKTMLDAYVEAQINRPANATLSININKINEVNFTWKLIVNDEVKCNKIDTHVELADTIWDDNPCRVFC